MSAKKNLKDLTYFLESFINYFYNYVEKKHDLMRVNSRYSKRVNNFQNIKILSRSKICTKYH